MQEKASAAAQKPPKQKSVDLTKEIKIIRSVKDFTKFIAAQKANAAPETVEDLCVLHDCVVNCKVSSVNRTKAVEEVVRPSIVVPPTIKREEAGGVEFCAPRHYVKFVQHRESQTGTRLSDSTSVNYNLSRNDLQFVENFNSRYAEEQISMYEFALLMDVFEKAAAACPGKFTCEMARLVAADNALALPPYAVREVHTHWARERRCYGMPLIRHLWPQASPNDTSPLAIFRPRAVDKMHLRRPRRTRLESIQRLFRVIDGFRRVLKILNKIKQRDGKRVLVVELEAMVFDQRCKEQGDANYVCPFWRCVLDLKRAQGTTRQRPLSTRDRKSVV